MRPVVVYYSLEGNTKFAAEKIAEKLRADVIELQPVHAYPTGKVSKYFWGGKSATFKEKPALKDYHFNQESYDTIVIGTPLWAWAITPPIRTFLSKQDLSQKRIAAFICCGGGNTKRAFDMIKSETGHDKLTAELTLVNVLENREKLDSSMEEFCRKIKS